MKKRQHQQIPTNPCECEQDDDDGGGSNIIIDEELGNHSKITLAETAAALTCTVVGNIFIKGHQRVLLSDDCSEERTERCTENEHDVADAAVESTTAGCHFEATNDPAPSAEYQAVSVKRKGRKKKKRRDSTSFSSDATTKPDAQSCTARLRQFLRLRRVIYAIWTSVAVVLFLSVITVIASLCGMNWLKALSIASFHKANRNGTSNYTNHNSSYPIEESASSKLSRFDRLVDFVVNQQNWTVGSAVADRKGPQWDACVWLAEFDDRYLDLEPRHETQGNDFTTTNDKVTETATFVELKERYAVAVLYFALNGREDWNYDMFWLSNTHICEWGITVDNTNKEPIRIGVDCTCSNTTNTIVKQENNNEERYCGDGTSNGDNSSTVKRLILPSMGLWGVFPPEIGLLEHLVELDVNHNDIGDTFPEGVRSMRSLEILNLNSVQLQSTIPNWIGEMSSLKILKLSNNSITGTIPNTFLNLSSSLEQLALSDNPFTMNLSHGGLPLLSQLSNLQILLASNIGLTGSFTQTWASKNKVCPNLTVLDLSQNHLTDGLPHDFFYHPSLAVVDLDGNSLSGSIPDVEESGQSSSFVSPLRYLSLHGNNLTGAIPQSLLTNHAPYLYHIDLSRNALSGPFPSRLPQNNLEYIDFSFNDFDPGSVPQDFLVENDASTADDETRSPLQHLALQRTNRQGSISEMFSHTGNDMEADKLPLRNRSWWKNLKSLDLGDNALEGHIPSILRTISGMQHLILYRNQLTGDFAQIMTNFHHLQTLVVHDNAWATGIQVAFLCSPDMQEFVMDHCVPYHNNTIPDLADSSSYCPCCKCCVAVSDNNQAEGDCAEKTHFLRNTDTAWKTNYTREHFRTNENQLIIDDSKSPQVNDKSREENNGSN